MTHRKTQHTTTSVLQFSAHLYIQFQPVLPASFLVKSTQPLESLEPLSFLVKSTQPEVSFFVKSIQPEVSLLSFFVKSIQPELPAPAPAPALLSTHPFAAHADLSPPASFFSGSVHPAHLLA